MSDQNNETTPISLPKFGQPGFSSNPGGGNKQHGFGQKSYKPVSAPKRSSITAPPKRG